jgi:hypothetical protein
LAVSGFLLAAVAASEPLPRPLPEESALMVVPRKA